ncbi:MAG TPA: TMEM43 family protein [Luteimonas sp.]|nr:TMEM43 family protein [Luteimonas sp.]
MPVRRGCARVPVGWFASLAGACALAALLPASAPARAMQPGDAAAPRGEVVVERTLRDPDFGVTTRHPGLQRHVEMYQWTRAGNGYALDWRGARVDSSGFAPGHGNPRAIPLREREWRARVTLDGKPLPAQVVNALGRWQSFRPNFSALPGNMSATFQPEGDGLGSAENPLAPQVGDLRITWRAFVLPPLPGDRLVLRDGKWTLRDGIAPVDAPPSPAADGNGGQARDARRGWALPAVVVVVLLVVAIAATATRRRRRADRRP